LVASNRIAVARPTPSCFISSVDRVATMENTATITTAALVTTPAEDTAETVVLGGAFTRLVARVTWATSRSG
jgi:hypothetical protein